MRATLSIVALALLCSLALAQDGDAPQCNSQADIIFAIDSSSNVGKDQFHQEVDFAVDLTKYFEIGKNDYRFGAVVFSKDADKLFDLEDYVKHSHLEKALREADYEKHYADTDKALRLIDDGLFKKKHGGRREATNFVILLTNGESRSFAKTLKAAQKLREDGVQILVAGDPNPLFLPQLEQIASSPSDVFTLSVRDVVSRIQNNSTVVCEEVSSEEESSSEEVCPQTADVIFALDGSHTLGETKWNSIVLFASAFVTNFTIGKDNVRFGAIVYSSADRITRLFDLEDYDSQDDLIDALQTAELIYQRQDDGRATHKALDYVDDHDLFSKKDGGRKKAPNTLVVISDGLSDKPSKTQEEARKLRKDGVKIISIGIGVNGALDAHNEITGIASPNAAFHLEDLNALEQAQAQVEFRTCQDSDED